MPGPAAFLPRRDGFAFTNSWPSEPAVSVPTPFGTLALGNAKDGLCGGMVFAALDYWHAQQPPPRSRPTPDDPLYGWLVRRLVDSWHLPAGVAQYFQWMNLPDGDAGFDVFGRHVVVERGLAWRTVEVQWPQVRADLDAGTPVALGLVTIASARPADLALNHQVLAYAYTTSGSTVTVQVYDPNSGPSDDVWLRFDTSDPTRPTDVEHDIAIGHRVRGFFRTAYAPPSGDPPPSA